MFETIWVRDCRWDRSSSRACLIASVAVSEFPGISFVAMSGVGADVPRGGAAGHSHRQFVDIHLLVACGGVVRNTALS
jgi:hypothetical protein